MSSFRQTSTTEHYTHHGKTIIRSHGDFGYSGGVGARVKVVERYFSAAGFLVSDSAVGDGLSSGPFPRNGPGAIRGRLTVGVRMGFPVSSVRALPG